MIAVMPKEERVEVRADSDDVKRWRAAAEADGRSLSNWIRQLCNAAAPSLEMIRIVEKNLAAIEKRERGTTKKGGRR